MISIAVAVLAEAFTGKIDCLDVLVAVVTH